MGEGGEEVKERKRTSSHPLQEGILYDSSPGKQYFPLVMTNRRRWLRLDAGTRT